MWRAEPTGGQPPYTYNWLEATTSPYLDQEYTEQVPNPQQETGWIPIWVKVTDANNNWVIAEKYFWVEPDAALDGMWCYEGI